MYDFPGLYFHPWLQPRHCATREDFLDLLATDKQWRDHAYTESERYQLRVELAQQQKKEAAVTQAKLVAEARYRAALQELTALFVEGTQVISCYPQAIVLSSDNSMADVYFVTGEGSFQWKYRVPAADVLPNGSIRLPDPPTPLTGSGPAILSGTTHEKKEPDTAPTVEAVGKLPTDRQLERALRRAAREIRGVGGKVTQATIGRKLTPRRGRNTVGKFLRQLGLKITDL